MNSRPNSEKHEAAKGIHLSHARRWAISILGWTSARVPPIFTLSILIVIAILFVQTRDWPFSMRIFPTVILVPMLVLLVLQLGIDLLRSAKTSNAPSATDVMDLPAPDVSSKDLLVRAGTLFGWIFGLMAAIWVIGLLIGVPLFVLLYLWVQAKQRWYAVLGLTSAIIAFELGILHAVVFLAWPDPIIGEPQEFILERLPFP